MTVIPIIDKPKKLFELLERAHFFYELKTAPRNKERAEWMNSAIGPAINTMMTGLLNDITILLEGDDSSQGYSLAFERYTKCYLGFDQDKLRDYYWFLCNTFKIMPSQTKTDEKNIPAYTASPALEKILIEKDDEDEVPF